MATTPKKPVSKPKAPARAAGEPILDPIPPTIQDDVNDIAGQEQKLPKLLKAKLEELGAEADEADAKAIEANSWASPIEGTPPPVEDFSVNPDLKDVPPPPMDPATKAALIGAGGVAGAGALGALAQPGVLPNAINSVAGPGTAISNLSSPSTLATAAYPAYVAGRSAVEIYDEAKDPNSKLAIALKDELRNYNESPSAANAVNFPRTLERGGEIVGENVVPKTATNLLNTLTSALSGGIKGVSAGLKPITDTAASFIGTGAEKKADGTFDEGTGVRGALSRLVVDPKTGKANPLAQLLGSVAMMSDKAPAANALVGALTGHPLKSNSSGNTSLDAMIQDMQNEWNRLNAMTSRSKEDNENWQKLPAMIDELRAKKAAGATGDIKSLPATAQKSFNDITQSYGSLIDSEKKMKWAIDNQDLPTFTTAINNAVAINSIANGQGVVTDPEATRMLAGVQTQLQQLQATGTPQDIVRFFSSDTWKSALNSLAVIKGNIQSRGLVMAQTYPELVPYFGRSNFPLTSNEVPLKEGETYAGKTAMGLDPSRRMTKEQRDFYAAVEAYKAQQTKTTADVNALRGMLKALQATSNADWITGAAKFLEDAISSGNSGGGAGTGGKGDKKDDKPPFKGPRGSNPSSRE